MKTVGAGALQSPVDYRYINLEHLAGATPETTSFPPQFHIDYSGVDDYYQRRIGACTNHAFVEIALKRSIRKGNKIVPSPRFLYTLSKINDAVVDKTEQGTYPVMPFKMAVRFGIATVATVPNETTLSFDEYIYGRSIANVPQTAFDEADQNRIIPGYVQVGGFSNVQENHLKQALMSEGGQDGVSICLPVGTEWYTSADGRVSWASADILPIRKVVAQNGAHEVTVTGWDTEEGTGRMKVYFRNHWSTAWADGDNGWFYLDQHTITEAWMVSEIPDAILAVVKALPNQAAFNYTWGQNLNVGSRGADVTNLQIAMKILGSFPLTQAVTDYYGNITRGAVMDFQRRYKVASEADIIAANGALGPKTRTSLNNIFSRK